MIVGNAKKKQTPAKPSIQKASMENQASELMVSRASFDSQKGRSFLLCVIQ